ncbi:MAG: hypothetical protein ACXIUV_14250 [Alkalilacustris sp.]
MTPVFRVGAALGLSALLAACNVASLPQIIEPAPADPGLDLPTQRAVAACLSSAEARGFDVRGVSNTSEAIGPGGVAVGQNVFVNVARGGQTFNVRCNYSYASSEARIMTL